MLYDLIPQRSTRTHLGAIAAAALLSVPLVTGACAGRHGSTLSPEAVAPAEELVQLSSAHATPQPVPVQHAYARRIGVSIGINQYLRLSHLKAAVDDARRMGNLFEALGYDVVERLEDRAATRDNILDLLEHKVPMVSGPHDLITVFFAGHGMSLGDQGFVMPVDARRGDVRMAISVQRLKESAFRMRAMHVLYLMDACFSGSMFQRARPMAQENDQAFWEAAAQGRVVQIMTAGGPKEMVLENGGWGSFTRSLYDGLLGAADANRNGVIILEELAAYTTKRVEQETGGYQHPLWGNIEGTGTVFLWNRRDATEDADWRIRVPRPLVRGMEDALRRVHAFIDAEDWLAAEELVRELMLTHKHVELHLLLAEVYLEADALGNATMIDAELKVAEKLAHEPDEERRLLYLRARLERVRRGPF